MQFFLIITNLMLSTITIVPTLVSANEMVRYIFNNGVEPSTPLCTSTEMAKIDEIFANHRRHLTNKNDDTSRQLRTFLGTCNNQCAGAATCHHTGCSGVIGTITKPKRNLATACETALATVDQKLDALDVSANCKKFIHKDTRTSECYDDVRYGEVLGAKLWTISGSTQTAVNLPSSGYSFCKSKNFNIEAVLNDCVDVAGFRLNGPNGYTSGRFENDKPYSLFGDYNGKFFGTTLSSTGTYTLTIKPDNYVEKQKTFTFTVNNC